MLHLELSGITYKENSPFLSAKLDKLIKLGLFNHLTHSPDFVVQ